MIHRHFKRQAAAGLYPAPGTEQSAERSATKSEKLALKKVYAGRLN